MRRVHVDWGAMAARTMAVDYAVIVVCDVLSFSTTVSVATARGIEVWPHQWADEEAVRRAAEFGALVAGPRSAGGLSLSPGSFAAVPRGATVVLPSPNGAACCLAASTAGAAVVAGCLRNAPAVAAWLMAQVGSVGVVAAGERWPDGSLRPAYEDWVGAGEIVARLDGCALTPEAEAAAAAARQRRPLADVQSGVELIDAGYGDDVVAAEDFGADDVVPLLSEGRFRPA